MIAYADIYNAANDEINFQPRCYVACWVVATDLKGNPNEREGSLRKVWAAKVIEDRLNITPKLLAFQLMRHPDVLANLNNSTDDQLRIAVLSFLDDLVAIG